MRLTARQLRQVIKEELARALKESASLGTTSVTTGDGQEHTLEITGLESGYGGDDAQGELAYTIDGRDFEWEFHSSYYPEGAAYNIAENLNDEDNEVLEHQIIAWLKKLNLST